MLRKVKQIDRSEKNIGQNRMRYNFLVIYLCMDRDCIIPAIDKNNDHPVAT